MAVLGADPDQLERAARTFQSKSGQTRAMAADLDSHMRATWWVGARSDEFRRYWFGTARQNMHRVAEALEDNAGILLRQAREQRKTSSPGGSTGGFNIGGAIRGAVVGGLGGLGGLAGVGIGGLIGGVGISRTGGILGSAAKAAGGLAVDILSLEGTSIFGDLFLNVVEHSPKVLGSFGRHLGGATGFFKDMAYHSHTVAKIAPALTIATAAISGIGSGFGQWIEDGVNPEMGGTERAMRAGTAGAVTGAAVLGGTAIGGMIGSFGGPIGTAAGMAVGGYIGGMAAPFLSDVSVAFTSEVYPDLARVGNAVGDAAGKAADLASDVVGSAADAIKSAVKLPKISFF